MNAITTTDPVAAYQAARARLTASQAVIEGIEAEIQALHVKADAARTEQAKIRVEVQTCMKARDLAAKAVTEDTRGLGRRKSELSAQVANLERAITGDVPHEPAWVLRETEKEIASLRDVRRKSLRRHHEECDLRISRLETKAAGAKRRLAEQRERLSGLRRQLDELSSEITRLDRKWGRA